MSTSHDFFATAPLGLELLLADELRGFGLTEVAAARAGVSFQGDLHSAYRACLWSRLANRVLLRLASFPAPTPEELYAGIRRIDWSAHMDADASLAVDFSASRSRITHSQFGAQKVKDAIVDQFRESCGVRPAVRLERPDVRINVYLDKNIAAVSLDLSGDSLHRRGYRLEGGSAPLKENLAAAILLRAGWPEIVAAGGELIDPMCGSGTLPIEAAWIAGDVAPGLLRDYFGFFGWKQHDAQAWTRLLEEAEGRRRAGLRQIPLIRGYDIDRHAVHAALGNIERAALRGIVHVEKKSLTEIRPRGPRGLLVANPPYGERLGDVKTLGALYAELGETLKTHFQDWNAAVFTGNPDLAFKLGIRASRFYKLYNGAIECKLFKFEVNPARFFTPHGDESGLSDERRKANRFLRRARTLAQGNEPSPGAEMFANRLRKNLKKLGRWAHQNEVACYRLYDADLPEYAVAVDVYQGDQTWLHVQEYEAPASIDREKAEARLTEALSVMPAILEIPPEQMFLKIRRKQKGAAQYEKQGEAGRFHQVTEGGCRFWVNFEDYLDTGLFLDHRPTRSMIQKLARGKRFLNLFAYTGSASVHAAAGGAISTTTVDMSATYLDWARRNLELNGMRGARHELIQADCLAWLDQAASGSGRRYDLIFLDPPTFSRSKRMKEPFDIQRDHAGLLRKAASLLAPEGLLIFSTNFRKFKLDTESLTGLAVEDITPGTIPQDFERNPRVHQCWIIRRAG